MRCTHNPKVGGSNPPPATNYFAGISAISFLPLYHFFNILYPTRVPLLLDWSFIWKDVFLNLIRGNRRQLVLLDLSPFANAPHHIAPGGGTLLDCGIGSVQSV